AIPRPISGHLKSARWSTRAGCIHHAAPRVEHKVKPAAPSPRSRRASTGVVAEQHPANAPCGPGTGDTNALIGPCQTLQPAALTLEACGRFHFPSPYSLRTAVPCRFGIQRPTHFPIVAGIHGSNIRSVEIPVEHKECGDPICHHLWKCPYHEVGRE